MRHIKSEQKKKQDTEIDGIYLYLFIYSFMMMYDYEENLIKQNLQLGGVC